MGPVEGLGQDIVEGVRRIKAKDGPDLIVWGSSTLTPVLLEHGLADEVLLLVYPVLLGGPAPSTTGRRKPTSEIMQGERRKHPRIVEHFLAEDSPSASPGVRYLETSGLRKGIMSI
jgi:riboflavin biosynthesis pyrimidine reductase